MKEVVVLVALAASATFAACRHQTPTRKPLPPSEAPAQAPRPTRGEPAPLPVGEPSSAKAAAHVQRLREDRDAMIGDDDDEVPRPSSIKPDAGILYDAGTPFPPVPDAGPLPRHDAGEPMH